MGGFEPPIPCGMPLFESGGFNHSPTSPFVENVTLPGIEPELPA